MRKTICIIDYNAGNIMSLYHTVSKISDYNVIISNKINEVEQADYLILPGVGSYSYVSKYLEEKKLHNILKDSMINSKKPILGICLGMQILFESSDEFGYSKGLEIFKGNVHKLPEDKNFPLPNIGWNKVTIEESSEIFKSGWYYFAHSFYVTNADKKTVIGTTSYGIEIPAVVKYNNFYGVQFHPEKSSECGIKFLNSFLNI
jgi:glutamine amidotransferase